MIVRLLRIRMEYNSVMDRFCPNCGRPMDKCDPLCGPGGMGCLYCTKHCPNCHREVFGQDIIYGESKEYCRYCRAEVEEEESQALENVLDDDRDYDDDNEDIVVPNTGVFTREGGSAEITNDFLVITMIVGVVVVIGVLMKKEKR